MDEIQIDLSNHLAHENLVKIKIKTVFPSTPFHLTVPSHIKVRDLRNLVAEGKKLPTESVRLISRGKALHDSKNGEEVYIQLADGDSFIVAVKPKAPPKHVRAEYDDVDDDKDNDDDLKFELPESASRWQRRLYHILHDRLKFPDIVLTGVFCLSVKTWVYIILWFMLAPVAHRYELGPIYIIATGFLLIFKNLGRRKEGELSAYSIFNKDFKELPGTFNADRVDRDIRAGRL
ncbi:uncharacterized protein LOC141592920 [Silene latifolia]|uniref:uncharacterized protein LOC141592920 n=1 Tax=Silene latifolia TaxID=37657 RepID=UPI003D77B432